jgi:hypothetical protein
MSNHGPFSTLAVPSHLQRVRKALEAIGTTRKSSEALTHSLVEKNKQVPHTTNVAEIPMWLLSFIYLVLTCPPDY